MSVTRVTRNESDALVAQLEIARAGAVEVLAYEQEVYQMVRKNRAEAIINARKLGVPIRRIAEIADVSHETVRRMGS